MRDLSLSTADEDVRIDPQSDADIEHWAHRLGVSREEFRRAAEQAGACIRDIRQHLIGGFTAAGPSS